MILIQHVLPGICCAGPRQKALCRIVSQPQKICLDTNLDVLAGGETCSAKCLCVGRSIYGIPSFKTAKASEVKFITVR